MKPVTIGEKTSRRLLMLAGCLLPMLLAGWALSQEREVDSMLIDPGDVAIGEMYMRFWHYFRMDNPREAGRLLLAEAQEKSADIDRIPYYTPAPRAIEFPSGVIRPEDSTKEDFLGRLNSLPEYVTTDDDEIICVVKRSRRLSIRETAEILSLGVKIYDNGPAYCYIARVPRAAMQTLVSLPYISWISEFKSEYKFDHSFQFDSSKSFVVESIINDRESVRNDLSHLGIEILWHIDRTYTVKMKAGDLVSVTSLWWVKEVFQFGPTTHDESYEVNSDTITEGRSKFGEMYRTLWQYFSMDNPVEAGQLLLIEAQKRSVDIDKVPRYTSPPRTMQFPSGTVDPKESPKKGFIERLESLPSYVIVGSDNIICAIKLSRRLSIRESAELLSLGTKIYDIGPAYCYIAGVPKSSVQTIVGLSYVDWISEFKSDFKYDHNAQFDSGKPFMIQSIVDDKAELRADLRDLGVRVQWRKFRYYMVTMEPMDVESLASLWWVKTIFVVSPVTID